MNKFPALKTPSLKQPIQKERTISQEPKEIKKKGQGWPTRPYQHHTFSHWEHFFLAGAPHAAHGLLPMRRAMNTAPPSSNNPLIKNRGTSDEEEGSIYRSRVSFLSFEFEIVLSLSPSLASFPAFFCVFSPEERAQGGLYIVISNPWDFALRFGLWKKMWSQPLVPCLLFLTLPGELVCLLAEHSSLTSPWIID